MKSGPPYNKDSDPTWDGIDPLWRLLGESPRPEPDAWFAARTLARCRSESSNERLGIMAGRGSLAQVWRWALAGGLAASMAVTIFMRPAPSQPAPSQQQNVQEAFEVVASMDSDTDASPTASWQDESL